MLVVFSSQNMQFILYTLVSILQDKYNIYKVTKYSADSEFLSVAQQTLKQLLSFKVKQECEVVLIWWKIKVQKIDY